MDVLPNANLFCELQDVTDTGYFERKLTLEDHWQQTWYEMEKDLQEEPRESREEDCATPKAKTVTPPNPTSPPSPPNPTSPLSPPDTTTAIILKCEVPSDLEYEIIPGETSSVQIIQMHKIKQPKRQFADDGRRVYVCDFPTCDKIYNKSSHLKSHKRSHTGEKPYVCTWVGCEWKFAHSDELTRHFRKHTGYKPFQCSRCERRYARSDHLALHVRHHAHFKAPSRASNRQRK